MNDLDALARLAARIETLERRVSVLEGQSPVIAEGPIEAAIPVALPQKEGVATIDEGGGVFGILGKAMLGMAGAYLLRAVAESGSVPKLAVVALALAYAAMWLVLASRTRDDERFASTVYATTAALILAPMLWELTLRFEVLPASVTAAILAAFVLSADTLAWKRDRVAVIWVSNVAAALTLLALLIATRDLVSFVAALLLIASASEVAACRNRWLVLRILVAIAADVATWILFYIYSRPEGIPAEYKNVASSLLIMLGCLPFLIYPASTAFRTIARRERIRIFEIGQNVITFLLAAVSILHFVPNNGAAILGSICLLLAAASYVATYRYSDLFPERFTGARNYHVYATWSLALLLAGTALCLTPLLLTLSLSTAAIAATLYGVRRSRLTLEFHGLAYLTAASYTSGLLGYAGRALAGTFPAAPEWTVWIVAASAIGCYLIGGRHRAEQWNLHVLQLLSGILAVAAAITFLVSVLVWLAAIGMTPGASHVAVIRTLITCAVALALAFSGSRSGRAELAWIAYGVLALVTAKLLFEDLQHGHPASTALSLLLYAIALILVPRMARIGRRA